MCFIVNGLFTEAKRDLADKLAFMPDNQYCIQEAKHRKHTTQLAFEHSMTSTVIIAVGGDGTLSECVNGIMQFKELHPNHPVPALGLVAAGSGNDFARVMPHLRLTQSWPFDIFHKLDIRPIDMGLMEHGNGTKQYFINIADAGFPAKAVKILESIPRFGMGSLRYNLAVITAFLTFRKRQMKVKCGEFELEKNMLAVMVCNGKYIGNGYNVAPQASVTDGLFHVTIYSEVSFLEYILNLGRLRKGKYISHPEVHYWVGKEITIQGAGETEADGELVDFLPVKMTVVRDAIPWIHFPR